MLIVGRLIATHWPTEKVILMESNMGEVHKIFQIRFIVCARVLIILEVSNIQSISNI